jgi:hypothetical protein
MSEKKAIKRSVRAVWDRVKALRAERGKLYGADEVAASAEQLAAQAAELQALAKQTSALSAMTAAETSDKPKRKRKAAANDAA